MFGVVHQLQDSVSLVEHALPGLSKRYLLCASTQQLQAQLFLKPCHMLGDVATRCSKPMGCRREAPATSRFQKMLYRREFVHMSIVSRSEEHTSELQSLMRIPYAVFCLKKK